MTKILLGKYGVFLSPKGLVKLHELKYEESYYYRLSSDNILTHISRQKFLEKSETLSTNDSIYLISHVHISNGTEWDSLDRKTLQKMWFNMDWFSPDEEKRADVHLIELFETANDSFFNPIGGRYDSYKVVEIPDDVDWFIQQDDTYGDEWVQEKSRTWS